jgi:hypothetical protein
MSKQPAVGDTLYSIKEKSHCKVISVNERSGYLTCETESGKRMRAAKFLDKNFTWNSPSIDTKARDQPLSPLAQRVLPTPDTAAPAETRKKPASQGPAIASNILENSTPLKSRDSTIKDIDPTSTLPLPADTKTSKQPSPAEAEKQKPTDPSAKAAATKPKPPAATLEPLVPFSKQPAVGDTLYSIKEKSHCKVISINETSGYLTCETESGKHMRAAKFLDKNFTWKPPSPDTTEPPSTGGSKPPAPPPAPPAEAKKQTPKQPPATMATSKPKPESRKAILEPLVLRKSTSSSTHFNHWMEVKAPFPNSACKDYLPPNCTFTKNTLIEFAEPRDERGGVTWNKRDFTSREWEQQLQLWEETFPVVSQGKRPPYMEPAKEKEGALTKARENMTSFEKCANIPKYGSSKFLGWKIDRYGNVINHTAFNKSLTFYDVDHIWPWSRGGRSVNENFECVHYHANRTVKNAKLIQRLSLSEMQTGISAAQFDELMKYCMVRSKGERTHTHKAQVNKSLVLSWLVRAPDKGESIGVAWKDANLQTGEDMWNFLEERFQSDTQKPPPVKEQQPTRKQPPLVARAPAPASAAGKILVFHRLNTIEIHKSPASFQIHTATGEKNRGTDREGKSFWQINGFSWDNGLGWIRAVSSPADRQRVMKNIKSTVSEYTSYSIEETTVDEEERRRATNGKQVAKEKAPKALLLEPLLQRAASC